MAKKPPVPVPAGEKYCHMCKTCLPLSAFYRRAGKPPRSPCKACAKASGERTAAMQRVMEEARAEVATVLAANPVQLPEERLFAPMDGFARWLERRR